MKRSFLSLLLLAGLSGVAARADRDETESLDLPKGSVAMRPIEGYISQVEPLCPPNARCKVQGTGIDMSFTMDGCADELSPLTYTTVESSKGLDVYVSAYNLANEASRYVRCITARVRKTRLAIVGKYYPKARVHFLLNMQELKTQEASE